MALTMEAGSICAKINSTYIGRYYWLWHNISRAIRGIFIKCLGY